MNINNRPENVMDLIFDELRQLHAEMSDLQDKMEDHRQHIEYLHECINRLYKVQEIG